MAAGVMLAFGVGWFSHTAWNDDWQSPTRAAALAKTRAEQDFVRQASFAHAVYSPEIRHPVEVTAAEQDHLVQWLSKTYQILLSWSLRHRILTLVIAIATFAGGIAIPASGLIDAEIKMNKTAEASTMPHATVVDIFPAGR